MSHIVSVQTEVRDPVSIRAACSRLSLDDPYFGEAKLFSATKTGWIVQLKKWRYPVVADVTTGSLAYDNYERHWGAPVKLDQFMQAYAVEKATIEARKNGHSVIEQSLDDGSIKLTVNVGGGS